MVQSENEKQERWTMFVMKKKVFVGLFAFAAIATAETLLCSENVQFVTFLTDENVAKVSSFLVLDNYTCEEAAELVISDLLQQSFCDVEDPWLGIEFVFAMNDRSGVLVPLVIINKDDGGWENATIKQLIDEAKKRGKTTSVICFIREIGTDFLPSVKLNEQQQKNQAKVEKDEIVDEWAVSFSPEEIERISQSIAQEMATDKLSQEAEEREVEELIDNAIDEEVTEKIKQEEAKKIKQEAEEKRKICVICLDDIENPEEECFPRRIIEIYNCSHAETDMHRECLRAGWAANPKGIGARCPSCRADSRLKGDLPTEEAFKKRDEQLRNEVHRLCTICHKPFTLSSGFPERIALLDASGNLARSPSGELRIVNSLVYGCLHSYNAIHRNCLRKRMTNWLQYPDILRSCPVLVCTAKVNDKNVAPFKQNNMVFPLPTEENVRLSNQALGYPFSEGHPTEE